MAAVSANWQRVASAQRAMRVLYPLDAASEFGPHPLSFFTGYQCAFRYSDFRMPSLEKKMGALIPAPGTTSAVSEARSGRCFAVKRAPAEDPLSTNPSRPTPNT